MEQAEYRYDVFLSYRHKPLDGEVTQRVFNLLEAYRMPKPLAERGCHGVRRAFRDTEELSVTRVLSDNIEQALRATDCLVVVCSPDTPSSEWVDREVATFIELGRSGRIYPLLIAGSPEESFPPSLKQVPDIASRVMDARAPKGGARAILKRARLELLRVVAGVSGCSHAELLRLHKLREARRLAGRYTGAAALFVLVFAGALALWLAARSYHRQARREQAASMAMLEQLTYELPNNLAELPGTYRRVAGILEENTHSIIRILEMAEDRAGVLPDIAANYEKLATASLRLGEYTLAEGSQREAIALYEELAAGGAGAGALRASAYNNYGVVLNAAGRYPEAAEAYNTALGLQQQLATEAAGFENQHLLLSYQGNHAANAADAGAFAEAAATLEETLAALRALEEESGRPLEADIARAALNLGTCRARLADYPGAEAALGEAVVRAEAYYERLPGRSSQTLLAQSLGGLATCYMGQAKLAEAFPVFGRAVEVQEQLAAAGEDVEQLAALAAVYSNYGLCHNMSGDFAAAAGWYIKAVDARSAADDKGSTPLTRAALARACYNVAENAFKLGDEGQMEAYYSRCLALYEPASRELGEYHRSEYLARLAYYQIISEHSFAAALASAEEAMRLQPESSFAMYMYAYALMYNGKTEESDVVFKQLAALSQGEATNIRLDFAALTRAGLAHEHMEAVLELLA